MRHLWFSMATKKLKDTQLINEGFLKNPRPLIIWIVILSLIIGGIFVVQWGLKAYLQEKICESAFNRVTNRELLPFLWQNPRFMRVHVPKKSGYLPKYQYLDKVTVEPQFADDFVVAPPQILFLYHVWNRQIGKLYIPRPISPEEFQDFLNYAEEWQPEYWDEAPDEYIQLVDNLSNVSGDLNDKLPLDVKQAFQGWKNYTKEGQEIQNIQPTANQMGKFLKEYPIFARNYWKNVTTNKYLQSYTNGDLSSQDPISSVQMTTFLKVAIYNYQHSEN